MWFQYWPSGDVRVVVSCVVGRGCLVWPVHFLGKTVLAFALPSFHIPRPNLPVTPGVSWLPTFAFQSPIMKRTSIWVLVLEGLVGLHRTIQLHLLQHSWLGHRLGLLWSWMVCLGNALKFKQWSTKRKSPKQSWKRSNPLRSLSKRETRCWVFRSKGRSYGRNTL